MQSKRYLIFNIIKILNSMNREKYRYVDNLKFIFENIEDIKETYIYKCICFAFPGVFAYADKLTQASD